MDVGTKELKNRLSHYLRQVRAGEVVRVSDRGTVIAELRPVVTARGDDAALRSAESAGLVSRGSGRFRDFRPVRVASRASVSRAVLEDRG